MFAAKLGWPSSESARQELKYERVVDGFAEKEKQAIELEQKILAAVSNDERSMDAARQIDEQVLPRWRALADELDDAPLSVQSRRYGLRNAVLAYSNVRVRRCKALVKVLVTNGEADVAELNAANAALENAIAEIRKQTS